MCSGASVLHFELKRGNNFNSVCMAIVLYISLVHTLNSCPPPSPPSQADGGRIRLEGTVCEEYYKVRQLLYEQFAII